MKINAIRRLQTALFLLFAVASFAQEASFNQNTIRSQFDYILDKSENYRDLKIVKTKWLVSLKENMASSYATVQSQLFDSRNTVNQQKAEIVQLQAKLKESNASLSAYTNVGPTVTFLGIRFNQHVFATIFTIIFLGSLLSFVFFSIRFKKANAITQHSKSILSELEDEYQEYKRRAIEREQKVSRQLQDEINKQKQFDQMKVS
ncbi:tRNA (guanine-N1)-methyltransferase [Flavobacterium sp.]|uniref:tRNA (guanine-N1)-methyltransferase n=1 Tax=Flavobacterium sp. TaxID=239 RepID=UPI003D6BE1B6